MRLVAARMYEREAVVEAIRRLLDAASAGRGGTVFVVAAAGLGKTSVLQAAAAKAAGRFEVRAGGGDAVEAALPYGLIGQVLGDQDELAVPGAGAADLPAAQRFYVALRRIRQAAARRPLLLALDDLHWSDPDSLTFVPSALPEGRHAAARGRGHGAAMARSRAPGRRAAGRAGPGRHPAAGPADRPGVPGRAPGSLRLHRR